MKKILLSALLMTVSAFGYSTWDVGTADYLAELGIIKDYRHEVSQYRLDDRISRQEVVGIAMKINGAELPENHICLGYFPDTNYGPNHLDAWVCRSVEMAADFDIISRANEKFRPKDFITRAEALAILLKSRNITYAKNMTLNTEGLPLTGMYLGSTPQWQIDLIEGAHSLGIIDAYTDNMSPDRAFGPSVLATRAEVFSFVYRIISDETSSVQKGKKVVNSYGTTTYTSADNGMSIAYPKGFVIENEEYESDSGSHVIVDIASENPRTFAQVMRFPCEDECTDTVTVFAEFKDDVRSLGATIDNEFEDNLIEVSMQVQKADGTTVTVKQYGKLIFLSNVAYLVTAATEQSYWETHKQTLLQIINSFRTL